MFSRAKKSVHTRRLPSRVRPDADIMTSDGTANRWVHRNQIKVGMYVNELDKPWEHTGFMFQGFFIDSQETLSAVQDACEYANVQTIKQINDASVGAQLMAGVNR